MNTQPLYTQFILKIPGKYGVTRNVTQNFHALVKAKKRRRKKHGGDKKSCGNGKCMGKLGLKLSKSGGKTLSHANT